MPKLYAIIAAIALISFTYGQYRGFSFFGSDAQSRSAGSGGGATRIYHK